MTSRSSIRSDQDRRPVSRHDLRRPVRGNREPRAQLRIGRSDTDSEQLGYDLSRCAGAQPPGRDGRSKRFPGSAILSSAARRNYPQYDILVDREKAAMAGLSQRGHRPGRSDLPRQQREPQHVYFHGSAERVNQYNMVVQLDEPLQVVVGGSVPPLRHR
jgi:hypothetical protein